MLPAGYYERGVDRPDLAPPGTVSAGTISTRAVSAVLAALLALLLPFFVTLRLPLLLALLALLLVFLEGTALTTVPIATVPTTIPATAALTAPVPVTRTEPSIQGGCTWICRTLSTSTPSNCIRTRRRKINHRGDRAVVPAHRIGHGRACGRLTSGRL